MSRKKSDERKRDANYYPFGLTFNSYQRVTAKQNDYLYNGKEKIGDLGLNWADYGARMYMSDVGRWNGVDLIADKYYNVSPYNYVTNNPLIFVDPDGMRVATREEMEKFEKAKKLGTTVYQAEEVQDDGSANLALQRFTVATRNLARLRGAIDFINDHIISNESTVDNESQIFDQGYIESKQTSVPERLGLNKKTETDDLEPAAKRYENLKLGSASLGNVFLDFGVSIKLPKNRSISNVGWTGKFAYGGSYGVGTKAYHVSFYNSDGWKLGRLSFKSFAGFKNYITEFYDKSRIAQYKKNYMEFFKKTNPSADNIRKYESYLKKTFTQSANIFHQ